MSGEFAELLRHAGKQVKTARETANVSQAELAARVGMTRASVANLEAGRQDMTISRLAGIAAALGMDLSALIPAELLPAPIQPRHKVTIRRVYEVCCETCGGAVLDIPVERAKAEEAKRDHIAFQRAPVLGQGGTG